MEPTVISRPKMDVTRFDQRIPYRKMDTDAINNTIKDASDTFSELLFCMITAACRYTHTGLRIAMSNMYLL